jgi:hypothetical protein
MKCKYILLPPSPVIMQMYIGESMYTQTIYSHAVQLIVCFYFLSLTRFFCDTLLETTFTQGNTERDTLYSCETVSHLTSDEQQTKLQMRQMLVVN